MPRAKKARRDDRVVTYVRLRPAAHDLIAKIATDRGYPHTIASVAAEMIDRGLEVAAAPPPEAT